MKHEHDVHAGKRLYEVRRKMNKTQKDIAKKLGISFQQIQKYETGANRISFSRLVAICRTLDVPPAHFFAGLDLLDPGIAQSADEAEMLAIYRAMPEDKRTAMLSFFGTS